MLVVSGISVVPQILGCGLFLQDLNGTPEMSLSFFHFFPKDINLG